MGASGEPAALRGVLESGREQTILYGRDARLASALEAEPPGDRD